MQLASSENFGMLSFMKVTRFLHTLLFVLVVFPGAVVLAQTDQSGDYDESFDPLKLQEPRDKFFQEESRQEVQRKLQEDSKPLPSQTPVPGKQKTGYRVQLIATPNYQEADSLLINVREEFQSEARAYLVYDSPNYKIRVGNCDTRNEAEALQSLSKQKGYRYAWIVRSTIFPDEKIWNNIR